MAEEPKPPNPRAKRHGPERRLNPRQGPASVMWYVLGFLLLLALAQTVFYSTTAGDTITYSEFKQYLREGQVQEVTVGVDVVRGVLRADEV